MLQFRQKGVQYWVGLQVLGQQQFSDRFQAVLAMVAPLFPIVCGTWLTHQVQDALDALLPLAGGAKHQFLGKLPAAFWLVPVTCHILSD